MSKSETMRQERVDLSERAKTGLEGHGKQLHVRVIGRKQKAKYSSQVSPPDRTERSRQMVSSGGEGWSEVNSL